MASSRIFSISSESTLISSPVFWTVAAILASLLIYNLLLPPASLHRSSPVKPYRLSLLPGLGPLTLYSQRNTFLRKAFGDPETWHTSPPKQNGLRLNSRGHVMTIVNDVSADAKTFFNDRGLDFNQGYEVMFAGIPQLPAWIAPTPPAEDAGTDGFIMNLKQAIGGQRLTETIPDIVRIIVENFKTYPSEGGELDVHKTIYPLVFQISVLLIGLQEHARDINAVKALETPFWEFADNTGFMATHFPLLPWPSTVKKWIGAIKMSAEIRKTLEQRKKEGRRENDHVQEMIDRGASTKSIEDFVMGGLFAAIINSTGIAAYGLIFLCSNPELRDQVRSEMDEIFRRSAEERGDDYDSLTLTEKLSRVPLSVWETDFPIYQTVLDETLRLLLISLIFRRKLSTPSKATHTTTHISSDRIRNREFVSFWLAAAHRNSNIYSDPLKFDPTRYARGEGKGDGEFVPWGAGRHICLGMRFAKLEIKAVHAAFLFNFPDARSASPGGEKVFTSEDVPLPDQESEHRRYPTKPVVLKYGTNHISKQSVNE
ncbi:hypothetical protein PHBOTO_003859 [Pseudozyma hubeiensis]|nr:hypothetical protein PHBOTO_003859 [Pseudozyma hubeiensis]